MLMICFSTGEFNFMCNGFFYKVSVNQKCKSKTNSCFLCFTVLCNNFMMLFYSNLVIGKYFIRLHLMHL